MGARYLSAPPAGKINIAYELTAVLDFDVR
jgi:hypothetical protein